MATPRKIETVQALTKKVADAKSIILADYRGLKHKQLEDLRRQLKKVNGEFVITKNRLLLKALGDRSDLLKDALNDTTATLFSYADEVNPLKEMLKFFKGAGFGKTKAALVGTTAFNAKDVTKLATLPSRDILLSKMVGQMQAPLYGLHNALTWNIRSLAYALQAIQEKKGKN